MNLDTENYRGKKGRLNEKNSFVLKRMYRITEKAPLEKKNFSIGGKATIVFLPQQQK